MNYGLFYKIELKEDEMYRLFVDNDGDFLIAPMDLTAEQYDLIDQETVDANLTEMSLKISSTTDNNFDDLLRLIDLVLSEDLKKESIDLKFCEGRKRSWLLENNLIQRERYLQNGIRVDVRWSSRQKGKFLALE